MFQLLLGHPSYNFSRFSSVLSSFSNRRTFLFCASPISRLSWNCPRAKHFSTSSWYSRWMLQLLSHLTSTRRLLNHKKREAWKCCLYLSFFPFIFKMSMLYRILILRSRNFYTCFRLHKKFTALVCRIKDKKSKVLPTCFHRQILCSLKTLYESIYDRHTFKILQ